MCRLCDAQVAQLVEVCQFKPNGLGSNLILDYFHSDEEIAIPTITNQCVCVKNNKVLFDLLYQRFIQLSCLKWHTRYNFRKVV